MPVYNTAGGAARARRSSRSWTSSTPTGSCASPTTRRREPHVRGVLERFASKDPRIKVAYRQANGHICEATNTALDLATGDYVALFDHDDVLSPTALYEVAAEIDAHPDAQLDLLGRGQDRHGGPPVRPLLQAGLEPGPEPRPELHLPPLGLQDRAHPRRSAASARASRGARTGTSSCARSSGYRPPPSGTSRSSSTTGGPPRARPPSSSPRRATRRGGADGPRGPFQAHGPDGGAAAGAGRPLAGQVPGAVTGTPGLAHHPDAQRRSSSCARRSQSILGVTDYPNFEIVIVDNDSDDPETVAYFGRHRQGRRPARPGPALPASPSTTPRSTTSPCARPAARSIGLLNNDVEAIEPRLADGDGQPRRAPGDRRRRRDALLSPQHRAARRRRSSAWAASPATRSRSSPAATRARRTACASSRTTAPSPRACLVIRKDRFLEVGGFNERDLPIAFNDVDLCCKLISGGLPKPLDAPRGVLPPRVAPRAAWRTPRKRRRASRRRSTT